MQPSFKDFNLSPTTLAALEAMGFETPTPIQAAAVPLLLQGEDVLGQAQTGTGKTAAFGLPIVEAFCNERRLGRAARGPRALVLVPTRELAIQVVDELNAIAGTAAAPARSGRADDVDYTTGFAAVAVYGGVGFATQARALGSRGATCIVATPGRLIDHLERKSANLENVAFLVLDEADRMLDMGFLPAVNRILSILPRDRQTAFFSATMPPEVSKLASRILREPETVRVGEDSLTTPLAAQYRVIVRQEQKMAALAALLEAEEPERALVFVRTRHGARRLGKRLRGLGHDAEALHGDLSQSQRERVMERFRAGTLSILVATDVAARGIDVPEVTHVINFDVPTEPETYVHRIGRTGRAGKEGRAFLLATGDERQEVAAIERLIEATLEPFDVGPLPDVAFSEPKPQSPFRHGMHRRERERDDTPRGRGRDGRGPYAGRSHGGERRGPSGGPGYAGRGSGGDRRGPSGGPVTSGRGSGGDRRGPGRGPGGAGRGDGRPRGGREGPRGGGGRPGGREGGRDRRRRA